jgi:hypothetical protein
VQWTQPFRCRSRSGRRRAPSTGGSENVRNGTAGCAGQTESTGGSELLIFVERKQTGSFVRSSHQLRKVLASGELWGSTGPDLSNFSRRTVRSLPFCLVADPQIVGQTIAGVATFLASGGAAYLGARAANRNTKVVDERAKRTAEWERIDRLVTMACSENETEAYVGLYLLQQSKADWNSDPEQRAHIKRTLDALSAPAIQAYRRGQTTVVTNPPPPPPLGGP